MAKILSLSYEDLIETDHFKEQQKQIQAETNKKLPLRETNNRMFRERFKKDPLDIAKIHSLKKKHRKEKIANDPSWTWRKSMSKKYIKTHVKSS